MITCILGIHSLTPSALCLAVLAWGFRSDILAHTFHRVRGLQLRVALDSDNTATTGWNNLAMAALNVALSSELVRPGIFTYSAVGNTSLPIPVGGSRLQFNTMFPEPPRVSTPNRTSIRSASFAHLSRMTDRLTDKQTDWHTSRYGIICHSSP